MRHEIAEHDPGLDPDHLRATAHATGVLVLALRLPPPDAEGALHAAARRYRVPVVDLATAVAATASGVEVTNRHLATIVRSEWGDLLAYPLHAPASADDDVQRDRGAGHALVPGVHPAQDRGDVDVVDRAAATAAVVLSGER